MPLYWALPEQNRLLNKAMTFEWKLFLRLRFSVLTKSGDPIVTTPILVQYRGGDVGEASEPLGELGEPPQLDNSGRHWTFS